MAELRRIPGASRTLYLMVLVILLLAAVVYVASAVLGPTARVLWPERKMLLRGLRLRILHPRVWADARREIMEEQRSSH